MNNFKDHKLRGEDKMSLQISKGSGGEAHAKQFAEIAKRYKPYEIIQ